MTRAKYKNAPIEEALVELQFVAPAGRDWDWTLPGRLAAKFSDYSGPPRSQQIVLGQHGAAALTGVHRVYLASPDGTKLLGLGGHLLSVHRLRPYVGWEELQPRVRTAAEVYSQALGLNTISRVGVHFINHISLPGPQVPLSECFTAVPQLPDVKGEAPAILGTVLSRIESTYADTSVLKVTLASQSDIAGPLAGKIVLDIEVSRSIGEVGIAEALAIADDLHIKEGAVFEGSITDKLRDMFNL
jgi:uncharacterized protein (TIGR04255 family)